MLLLPYCRPFAKAFSTLPRTSLTHGVGFPRSNLCLSHFLLKSPVNSEPLFEASTLTSVSDLVSAKTPQGLRVVSALTHEKRDKKGSGNHCGIQGRTVALPPSRPTLWLYQVHEHTLQSRLSPNWWCGKRRDISIFALLSALDRFA